MVEIETKVSLMKEKIKLMKCRQGFKKLETVCGKPRDVVKISSTPILTKLRPDQLPKPKDRYVRMPLEQRLELLNVEITGREGSAGNLDKVNSFVAPVESEIRSTCVPESADELPPPPPPPTDDDQEDDDQPPPPPPPSRPPPPPPPSPSVQ